MSREARMMAGIILITVPTIQYGGYFLLTFAGRCRSPSAVAGVGNPHWSAALRDFHLGRILRFHAVSGGHWAECTDYADLPGCARAGIIDRDPRRGIAEISKGRLSVAVRSAV